MKWRYIKTHCIVLYCMLIVCVSIMTQRTSSDRCNSRYYSRRKGWILRWLIWLLKVIFEKRITIWKTNSWDWNRWIFNSFWTVQAGLLGTLNAFLLYANRVIAFKNKDCNFACCKITKRIKVYFLSWFV